MWCLSHALKSFQTWLSLGGKKNNGCIATTYSPFCFSQPLEFTVFCLLLRSLSKAILQDIDTLERKLIISDLRSCVHPWIASLGEAFSTQALTEHSRGRKGLLWQLFIIYEPLQSLFSLKNSFEEKIVWSPRVYKRDYLRTLVHSYFAARTLFTGLSPMVSVSIRCMW